MLFLNFVSDWKLLYKALRKSDLSRSGTLKQNIFAYHLMEFGVPLTTEELTFLSTTMGKVIGPVQRHGMSLSRAQSASIQRGRRRPSTSVLGQRSARAWGNSLRKSVTRPQTASMRRSVKSLGTRQISYSLFMKRFVLSIVGANNTGGRATMRPGSALSGTIDRSLFG